MSKIERIQYRALQFLHNDYDSDYNTLLKKSDKCSVEIRKLRTMALFNKRNNINRRKL